MIWAADDEESPEFRCRIGHAYSTQSLLQAHADSVEDALWAGIRALRKQASLTKRPARKASYRDDRVTAARLQERGETADEHAAKIEAMLLTRAPSPV